LRVRRRAPKVKRMQGGDIALAGFMLTAEEWQELDAISRAQLIAAAYHRDAPWLSAPISALLTESATDGERT
jgi:hypothetical protein